MTYDRETLEWLKANGHRVRLDVHGLFQIKDDVTADLADETIESVMYKGVALVPQDIRTRLGSRFHRG